MELWCCKTLLIEKFHFWAQESCILKDKQLQFELETDLTTVKKLRSPEHSVNQGGW